MLLLLLSELELKLPAFLSPFVGLMKLARFFGVTAEPRWGVAELAAFVRAAAAAPAISWLPLNVGDASKETLKKFVVCTRRDG
jgi:hypothetical protein